MYVFKKNWKRLDKNDELILFFLFPLQKKRADSRINGDDGNYRSTTTPYPHQRPQSPDIGGFLPNSTSAMSRVGSSGALAYMLSGSSSGIPDALRGVPPGATACEIHLNSSYLPGGNLPPGTHLPGGQHYGPPSESRLPWGLNWLRPLLQCCRARSPLAKFPSRAKRIDVISRFVFPLVFAVFNLAYWLYYLFAKSKSPQDLS